MAGRGDGAGRAGSLLTPEGRLGPTADAELANGRTGRGGGRARNLSTGGGDATAPGSNHEHRARGL